MIWHIAVLDDDEEYLKIIINITEEYMKNADLNYEIVGYTSSKELLDDVYAGNKKDIYLLDIELPNMNGLELAKQIRFGQLNAFIIFITNYIQYAVPAFEVNTFRYIPKNMLCQKLPEAYYSIQQIVEKKRAQKKYYVFETGGNIHKIQLEDIVYLMKESKYVKIICKKQTFRIRKTLADVLANIDSKEFLLIERGYVVNMEHVVSVQNRQVVLDNDTVLFVAYARWKEIKQAFLELGE